MIIRKNKFKIHTERWPIIISQLFPQTFRSKWKIKHLLQASSSRWWVIIIIKLYLFSHRVLSTSSIWMHLHFITINRTIFCIRNSLSKTEIWIKEYPSYKTVSSNLNRKTSRSKYKTTSSFNKSNTRTNRWKRAWNQSSANFING